MSDADNFACIQIFRMDGWLAFYGILSTKVVVHHAWNSLKFIDKVNGMYKRKYSFTMNIIEEIFRD